MPLKDWAEIARNDLVLPILGENYTIPPLGYLDELRIRESQKAAAEWMSARDAAVEKGEDPPDRPEGIDDETFLKMVLGGALKQMRDDNVPGVAILHAASVAHTAALHGRPAAEALWEKGMDPEALAAEMAAFRENLQSSKDSTPSPSTASASKTRSRASTTATTSRPATRPRKAAAKKAGRSSGTTSSRNAT
jgi:hypothetical protein